MEVSEKEGERCERGSKRSMRQTGSCERERERE